MAHGVHTEWDRCKCLLAFVRVNGRTSNGPDLHRYVTYRTYTDTSRIVYLVLLIAYASSIWNSIADQMD
jgi:hypothetical protein